MPRDYELFLQDMIEAINKIQQYTKGLSYESFANNQLVVDATIFKIITLGEAASKVPKDILEKIREIPWKALIGMRNILVHQYHRVDTDILWNLIQAELESIKTQVKFILEKNVD